MKRYAIAILAVLTLISTLCSCSREVGREYCEFGISLPKEYKEQDSGGSFDAAYSNGEAVVGITRISFEAAVLDGIPATLSPLKFAELYKERTDRDWCRVILLGDVPYITYPSSSDSGKVYTYLIGFYRTPYAYFTVTFVTEEKNGEKYQEEFLSLLNKAYIIEITP